MGVGATISITTLRHRRRKDASSSLCGVRVTRLPLVLVVAALVVPAASARGGRGSETNAKPRLPSAPPGIAADLAADRAEEVVQELDRLARVPDEGTVLGRIEIPSVGISAVIREGIDDVTIRRGVGHFPDTPMVEEGGNTALAAHRTSDFRGLRDIRVGDAITVVSPQGAFEFVVATTWVVAPEEVWVLDPTADPSLTLVTCYPFDYPGHAPRRFVVRAVRPATPDG